MLGSKRSGEIVRKTACRHPQCSGGGRMRWQRRPLSPAECGGLLRLKVAAAIFMKSPIS